MVKIVYIGLLFPATSQGKVKVHYTLNGAKLCLGKLYLCLCTEASGH